MAEHRTRIAPDVDVFALSPAERRRVSPTEDYTLSRTRVENRLPEIDLFAGLRAQWSAAEEVAV